MDMFPSTSQDSSSLYNPNLFGFGSALDGGGYGAFDTTTDMTLAGLSTTPPSSSFAATGLPFRGLEYIRNYNLAGFNASGDINSLWQSYDPDTFRFDPDLPFTIGDPASEIQDATLH
jgi:hypothetical protein